MLIKSVTYKNADKTLVDALVTSDPVLDFSGNILVEARDIQWIDIDLAAPALVPQAIREWIEAGGVPAPYVAPVPTTVSPRQARIALLNAGLLDQAEAAVDAAGGATKITWEYATQFDRSFPLIDTLGQALGLTGEQIDALFISAAEM